MMAVWSVYYLITVAEVAADILEGPQNGSFSVGCNVTLACIVEGKPDKTFWIDAKEITPIFYNREKVGSGEKYDNFYFGSSSYTDFSLHILNANVTDDGKYTCQAGNERRTATITIEAPPTLSLSINGSWYEKDGGTLKQNSTWPVTITCNAVGAKPAVKLRLKINDGQWIEQLDTYITQKDVYFDSYISYGYRLSRNDVSVTCEAFGQTAIASTNITEAFFLPACEIIRVAEDVICNCDAFPPVYKYVILVDGKNAKEADRITIVDYPPAEYTCLGTNYIGTTQSKSISTSEHSESNGFGVVAIGVVSLTVIILLGVGVSLTLYLRKRKQHATYAGELLPAMGNGLEREVKPDRYSKEVKD